MKRKVRSKHKEKMQIKKVRKLYQKQTKEKLVDECVLLYEHVQKLGKEKMIRELSDGLNDYKK